MSWLNRHAHPIEAIAATVTALVAVAALIGVNGQLEAADQIQRATTARDAYRNHLALAVAHPEFAQPKACAPLKTENAISYFSFVDHLLYSAELMLETEEGWDAVFMAQLAPHAAFLCGIDAPTGDTEKVVQLLTRFRELNCAQADPCE